MNTRITGFAVVLSLAAAQQACAPSGPKDATFSGTWRITSLNGITETKDERMVSVVADKGRFRIFSKTSLSEITEVFDGRTLYQKIAYPLPAGSASGGGAPPTSEKESNPSPARLARMRFWVRSQEGKSSPDWRVAGREAVLHQVRQKRPDGEITGEVWTDSRTGVALKYALTVNSSQVDRLVSKTTEECQEIRYGPVEESAFAKP